MVAVTEVLLPYAEALQPIDAELLPIGEPFEVCARLAEELALHLLKFAGTEGEIARGYLVAERLAHLANSERELFAGGALYVGEVYKYALSGLRAEIYGGGRILGNAYSGLEHEVELADRGKVVLSADRADDV